MKPQTPAGEPESPLCSPFSRLVRACAKRLRRWGAGAQALGKALASRAEDAMAISSAGRLLIQLSPKEACEVWCERPFDVHALVATSFEMDASMRHGYRLPFHDAGDNPYPVVERLPFIEALRATVENRAHFMEPAELAFIERCLARMESIEEAREISAAVAAPAPSKGRRL